MTTHKAPPFSNHNTSPLPVSWEECLERGWKSIDILLVTGDYYIDHPSFGISLIGRLLESHGYRVAVLAQPRYDCPDDFLKFPTPKLFCGITAGNLDSIVANYSGNGKVRDNDAYSPAGNPYRGETKSKKERRRPDRACIIYTTIAKSVFKDIPIVLGGLEASLRRFIHFDYKQNRLRLSILSDSKADLIAYGMAEKTITEIARRCSEGISLTGIHGTSKRFSDNELQQVYPELELKNSRELLLLPSWNDIQQNRVLFLEAEVAIDRHSRSNSRRIVAQQQKTDWLIQYPNQRPLTTKNLDDLYSLPFTRRPHPSEQRIPAYDMIKDSVTIVRGCFGNCSFCSIAKHQGPHVSSRSIDSIYKECKEISERKDFRGTISDLGGPTANLFGCSCKIGSCKKHDCLYPKICPNLLYDEHLFLTLLKRISSLSNIKRIFISSGLRMELLLKTPLLLEKLVQDHTPGALKIAPEHTSDTVLKLMNKQPHKLLKEFTQKCSQTSKKLRKRPVELMVYVLLSHPGSTPESAAQLASDLKNLGVKAAKPQDFTPTPGTLSTAMYFCRVHKDTKQPIPVPNGEKERRNERQLFEKYFYKSDATTKNNRNKKRLKKK